MADGDTTVIFYIAMLVLAIAGPLISPWFFSLALILVTIMIVQILKEQAEQGVMRLHDAIQASAKLDAMKPQSEPESEEDDPPLDEQLLRKL